MSSGSFEGLRILTPPGVYAPRSDSSLLASAMGRVEGARVLELCAGTGAVGLVALMRGAAALVTVDRSRLSALTVRINARLNRFNVQSRHGELWRAVDVDERFDLILANPPYLPLPEGRRPDARWDAGPDGRAVIDQIIAGAAQRLVAGGRLLFVQSGLASIPRSCEALSRNNLNVRRCVQSRGAWGPLVSRRRAYLMACGAMLPSESQETLAVLEGQLSSGSPRGIETYTLDGGANIEAMLASDAPSRVTRNAGSCLPDQDKPCR